MRALLTLLLLCPVLQDSDSPERLIEALGANSPEERESAQEKLMKMGSKAVPALKKARESSDAEVRTRAKCALEEIERMERETSHDAAERKRVFGLKPGHVGGLGLSPVCTEGAHFWTRAEKFRDGTVLHTSMFTDLGVNADFEVASIVDEEGHELPIERCGRCSPGMVFVAYAGPIRPRLTGKRIWKSIYHVEFENPSNGDVRKIGDFTIKVDWPLLKIQSPRGWPEQVMNEICDQFEYDLKPGVEGTYGLRVGQRENIVVRGGGREPRKYWCRCDDGPKPVENKQVALKHDRTAEGFAAKRYALENVSKIMLTFGKPVQESFELTGPEIRRE